MEYITDYGFIKFGKNISDYYKTKNTETLNLAGQSGTRVKFPSNVIEINNTIELFENTHFLGNDETEIIDTRPPDNFCTFSIKGSNVKIKNIIFDGKNIENTYVYGHRCIFSNETIYYPTHQSVYLFNCEIENVTIKNYGYDGILVNYWINGKINHNKISWIGYRGIMMGAGCFDSSINFNEVSDIRPGKITEGTAPYHPAYGITVTRDPSRSISDAPISRRISICNNKVSRVYSWNGIDLHGAREVDISRNHIIHCFNLIHLEDGDAVSVQAYSPVCTTKISDNFGISSFGTNWDAGRGINVSGASTAGHYQDAILITGNILLNCGCEGGLYPAGIGGAIHVYMAQSVVISSNIMQTSVGVGLWLDNVRGAAITGNTFANIRAHMDKCHCIWIADGDVLATIVGNSFYGASSVTGLQAATAPDSGYGWIFENNVKFGSMTLMA